MPSIRFAVAVAALACIAGQSPALASGPAATAKTAAQAVTTQAVVTEVAAAGVTTTEVSGVVVADFNPHRFAFPAGIYRCELNRSVDVRQVAADMQSAVVRWNKKDYTLRAVSARSGALRYEDAASGLVWIMIVGKSMLLDTRHGKQLANECKV